MKQLELFDKEKWCYFNKYGECYGRIVKTSENLNGETVYHVDCICTKTRYVLMTRDCIKSFHYSKKAAWRAYNGYHVDEAD